MFSYLGMALIIFSWGTQLFNKQKEIKSSFIPVYAIGVGILVVDLILNENYVLSIFNAVSALVAFAVWYKNRK